MDDFKVSAIVPLYNKGSLVIDTIESILNQSYRAFEIIIVDDGSTDNSLDYVIPYLTDNRIHLITQKNSGPGAARNIGVKQASYSWVSFIDADDIWHQDFLLHAKQSLSNHADCDFFFAKATRKANELGRIKKNELSFFDFDNFISTKFSPTSFKGFCDTSSGAMMAKKKIFIEEGGFFEGDKCVYGEDSFLITIILINNHVLLSNRPLLLVRQNENGLTHQAKTKVQIRPLVSNSDIFYSLVRRKHLKEVKHYICYLSLLNAKELSSKGAAGLAWELILKNFNVSWFCHIKTLRYFFITLINISLTTLLKLVTK